MSPKTVSRILIAVAILIALVILPIPLLPPEYLVEFAHSHLGLGKQAAYLFCAIAVQASFYGALGLSTTFAINRAETLRGRTVQAVVVPLVVVGLALIIRSVRAGQAPVWINAVVPVAASLGGVILGLSVLFRHWKVIICMVALATSALMWTILAGGSPQLRAETENSLRRIVAAGPGLPPGDARFGLLLQTAFATSEANGAGVPPIEKNRGAILAFGIAVGHPNIALFIGLKPDTALVQRAVAVSRGTTLNGREDWSRHYAVSAALAVLQHPLVSDAGGLMKEQLDTLTRGSGFSFGDLAADRAGVRFAIAATGNDEAARAIQARLHSGFFKDDFFPREVRFPENLSTEEFRRNFGRVGSDRYQLVVSDIEASLDRCGALSSH